MPRLGKRKKVKHSRSSTPPPKIVKKKEKSVKGHQEESSYLPRRSSSSSSSDSSVSRHNSQESSASSGTVSPSQKIFSRPSQKSHTQVNYDSHKRPSESSCRHSPDTKEAMPSKSCSRRHSVDDRSFPFTKNQRKRSHESFSEAQKSRSRYDSASPPGKYSRGSRHSRDANESPVAQARKQSSLSPPMKCSRHISDTSPPQPNHLLHPSSSPHKLKLEYSVSCDASRRREQAAPAMGEKRSRFYSPTAEKYGSSSSSPSLVSKASQTPKESLCQQDSSPEPVNRWKEQSFSPEKQTPTFTQKKVRCSLI